MRLFLLVISSVLVLTISACTLSRAIVEDDSEKDVIQLNAPFNKEIRNSLLKTPGLQFTLNDQQIFDTAPAGFRALGVTEDECSAMDPLGFVCPVGGSICCCEGYLDCTKMKNLVNACQIDYCETSGSGREICSCTPGG